MNSKQIFRNQDLFSWCFLDKEFENKNQVKINLKSDFKEAIAKDIAEAPDARIDPEKYAEYELSMQVGKSFFYFAFIQVFAYQRRLDFLNYQFDMAKDKISFLQRVESLSQVDYWYAFGEFSYYNPETEKLVADWVIAKYKGAPDPKPLILVKP